MKELGTILALLIAVGTVIKDNLEEK